jgi:hypothetical protein
MLDRFAALPKLHPSRLKRDRCRPASAVVTTRHRQAVRSSDGILHQITPNWLWEHRIPHRHMTRLAVHTREGEALGPTIRSRDTRPARDHAPSSIGRMLPAIPLSTATSARIHGRHPRLPTWYSAGSACLTSQRRGSSTSQESDTPTIRAAYAILQPTCAVASADLWPNPLPCPELPSHPLASIRGGKSETLLVEITRESEAPLDRSVVQHEIEDLRAGTDMQPEHFEFRDDRAARIRCLRIPGLDRKTEHGIELTGSPVGIRVVGFDRRVEP